MFIHHEEHGHGDPILCIHGTGSSALVWSDAVRELARIGRVIAYDRRGCTRSERPEPYERTNVAEHAERCRRAAARAGRGAGDRDRAQLRRNGGARARAPQPGSRAGAGRARGRRHARAGAGHGALARRGRRAPARGAGRGRRGDADGRGAGGGHLAAAAGRAARDRERQRARDPGRAQWEWWLSGDPAQITAPTLLVAATDSRPELREPTEALARVLPDARLTVVPGGHLIDPAGPEVLAFVRACCRA